MDKTRSPVLSRYGLKGKPAAGFMLAAILLAGVLSGCAAGPGPASPTPAPTGSPANPTVQHSPTPVTLESTVVPVTGGCPVSMDRAVEGATLKLGPLPGMAASEATGERLVVTGTVYDPGCTPQPGLMLRVWQADPEGVYGPGHGTQEMECCYYQGAIETDENGRYTLITVMPGFYRDEADPPPAHIHVEIILPGQNRAVTGTEIVFEGDPHLGRFTYTNPPPIPLERRTDLQGDYLLGSANLKIP